MDTVVLGRKFFMRYVAAVLYKLFVEGKRRAIVRGYGRRNVYRAVLVATSVMHLVKEARITRAETFTTMLTEPDTGKQRYIPGIEIELSLIDYTP